MEAIFGLGEEQLTRFLGVMYACDGHVHCSDRLAQIGRARQLSGIIQKFVRGQGGYPRASRAVRIRVCSSLGSTGLVRW